eukprot:TRINITY_DN17593_c0_g1_i1.p1 TRINITY_DN17593_c0_g1~~TRINITY_DN17593_c0_g1_i1.p1  ORF type:complete len:305 (-),score=38.65 TRINITY_DN17593_c0_g1_i1:267-1181(-)
MSLFVLLSLLPALASAAPKLGDQVATGAALLFGQRDIFLEGPKRTSYGTLGSEFVINELLTSILSNEPTIASRSFMKEDQTVQAPNKIFVFLGEPGQKYSEDYQLRNAWETSSFGLALPNVVYMDHSQALLDDVLDRLEQVTTGMIGTKLYTVGDCAQNSKYTQLSAEQALGQQQDKEGTQIIMWCPLDHNLNVLSQASDSDYLVVFLSDISAADTTTKHYTRTLLATEIADEPENRSELPVDRSGRELNYSNCDLKCYAQVRMIEVYFLFWIMIIAMISGLACTNLLEGPTRFEQEKRETQND